MLCTATARCRMRFCARVGGRAHGNSPGSGMRVLLAIRQGLEGLEGARGWWHRGLRVRTWEFAVVHGSVADDLKVLRQPAHPALPCAPNHVSC
eukprot:1533335-Rhodomonas_salina.5